MDQTIIELHEEHTQALLDRRVVLERLWKLTGSAASALAPLRQASQACAAINGYLVRPKGAAKLPAVIVEAANTKLVIHAYEAPTTHSTTTPPKPATRSPPRIWRGGALSHFSKST